MDVRRRMAGHRRRDLANLEWWISLILAAVVFLVYWGNGAPDPRWLWVGVPLALIALAAALVRRLRGYDEKDRDWP